ncbi:MAG: TldD/PmbA family protein [Candidatus Eiseniibacteriota bacterium]|nr:MAG: TldD/PmbA family protein [Candidatus Eisenbacteria bacterium]
MNKELHDLAGWSVKTALSSGADNCRVGISGERFVQMSYRERKPENIKEASTRELVVEIFAKGRYSAQSTSDLRRNALTDFIAKAVATTGLLAEDPYRALPDPKYYEGRADVDLKIIDPDYPQLTAGDRHDSVKTIEEACLTEGGEKIITVTAMAQDTHEERVVLTSNGFEGYANGTSYWAGARVTAQDEGDRRPAGYNFVASVARRKMPSPGEIGAVAARRTLSLLGAKKLKTETLPIIVENRNVPTLLGALLEAMSGWNIHQKRSFLADKKGQKVASEHLTLIDDPLLVGGLGSRLFDGDGFAAKKRVMIESGVLKDFYVDWYYSRKLDCEPTTGGSSNLIIPPGKRSVAEIMKDLGRGIYITGFIGGNSNSTTGDASIGIFGHLFEDGKPTQAVAEMNIADNQLKFWPRLIEVANDPWVYSSRRTPSLVFADVVVAGV